MAEDFPNEQAKSIALTVTYTYEYADDDSIDVTFTTDDIVHTRGVNNTGDSETFEARVKEVAMGVENKISAGVINNGDPEDAPEAPRPEPAES